jgi:uncharacterized protein (TIGR02271 family)
MLHSNTPSATHNGADTDRNDPMAKLDLNEVTREELVDVAGLRPTVAEAVLRARDEHGGGIADLGALKDALGGVKGIGPATLDQLGDVLKVGRRAVKPADEKPAETAPPAAKERVTIPVVEERAVVRKRKRVTGAVRVRTEVRTAEEVVDAPLAVEQVEVERRPLDRWIDAPVPVRQEGDTTVITLHEEVVVVEKRLRATEEVRITRRTSTRHAEERVTLRREEAVVERLDAAEAGDGDPG